MNVKQWITDPVSPLFQALDLKKQEGFRGGFEPIPDLVIFSPGINADWRRRNREETLCHMLLAVEVKASERREGRLNRAEIVWDIEKLAAHRLEVRHKCKCGDMHPVVMIIDTAPIAGERMREWSLQEAQDAAVKEGVSFFYLSPSTEIVALNGVTDCCYA